MRNYREESDLRKSVANKKRSESIQNAKVKAGFTYEMLLEEANSHRADGNAIGMMTVKRGSVPHRAHLVSVATSKRLEAAAQRLAGRMASVVAESESPVAMPIDSGSMETHVVEGDSMLPALRNGDRVIVNRDKQPKPGQIAHVLIGDSGIGVLGLYGEQGNKVVLTKTNPSHPPITLDKSLIKQISLVTSMIRQLA